MGRANEQAQLAQQVAAAVAGAPCVLVIEGEAGIGKSRLLAEAAHLAQARGLRPLYGSGQDMERATPYFAWRAALMAALGLKESDPVAEQRRRVEEWGKRVPELAERLPLLNAVLSLDLPETPLLAPLSPAEQHALRTELLIDLLRHSADGPPVLLLEDAQWFDSRSWALALALACACLADHTPLLLVLTIYPLEAEERPVELDALLALPGALHLRLAPLANEIVLSLAATRLGMPVAALPAELAGLLCERAEGNPFLAEELALAIREQVSGPLASAVAGSHQLHNQVRMELPDTVQGVILARIDRLSLEEQLTLKVGAVIGRSFSYQPLRAALHSLLPAESMVVLGGSLLTLTRRDMLTTAQQSGRSYLFRQSVIREVAYDTLLFAQRRVLHRAVAEWFEQTYDQPGELAPHYALLAGHWDAADDAERSVYYLTLAGEQALRASALREASAMFARALGLLAPDTPPARRAELHTRLGITLWYAGDLEAAASNLQAGLQAARNAGDRQRSVETLCYLGRVQIERGDYAAARATIEAALALVGPADDPAGRLLALRYLGVAATRQGDPAAGALLDEALDLAQRANDRFAEAAVLIELGNLATNANAYDQAAKRYQQALAVAEAIGHRWSMAIILGNLGELAARQGDYAQAIAHNQASLAIDRAIGNRLGLAMTSINTGEVAAATGDRVTAARCYAEALPLALGSGNNYVTLYGLYDAAQLLAGAGQLGEAAALLALIQSHPGADDLAAVATERLAALPANTGEALFHLADGVAAGERWLAALC